MFPLSVFISSKQEELNAERDIAEKVIKSLNMLPIRSEQFGARPVYPGEACLAEVRSSEIIVLILGKEFSEIVTREYEEAKRPPKKDVLVYIKTDDESRDARLKEFIGTVEDEYFYGTFKDAGDLEKKIRHDLLRLLQERFRKYHAPAPGFTIEFDENDPYLLGPVRYEDLGIIRKFARLEVWNHGPHKAEGVTGILEVISGPRTVRARKLHFAYTPEQVPEPLSVEISRGSFKMLDIAFSQPQEANRIVLAPDSYVTSSPVYTEPVPGTFSTSIELPSALEIHSEGCYIATNDALRHPRIFEQDHLPPSEYTVEIVVSADNLDAIRKRFKITSPRNWSDLQMKQL